MRMAVTGGSGFIGTNLIADAVRRGHEVVNYDILPPRDHRQRPLWRPVDILKGSDLTGNIRDWAPDVAVHLAATTDLVESKGLAYYSSNTVGVENILSALSATPSVTRVIFASTMLVCRYGHTPSAPEEYAPNTLYGESKMIGERRVRAIESHYAWTIIRPTSIWGPYCDQPYKPFLRAVTRGRYFHPGDRPVSKALGFVGNTVYQIFRLLEAREFDIHRKTFYLLDYPGTTIRDWAGRVQALSGAPPIRTLPVWVLRGAGHMGDLLRYIGWKNPPMSSFRLRNMLTSSTFDGSDRERIVGALPYSLDDGVRLTLDWLGGKGVPDAHPETEANLATQDLMGTGR
jgi:GlcNAc-P-P-Und epimerase